MMLRTVAFAVLLAALCAGERLPPRDDAASDPSFLAFRVKLLAAIQRHDVKAVQAMTDEGARGSVTPASLSQIGTAMRLGVARDDRDFIAPYLFVSFPKDLDAYTYAAAIRPAVKVRSRPAAAAAAVETLDYDIVQLAGPEKNGWVEVRTPSGRSGWVLRAEVRTQLETRVFFEKKDGSWRITGVASGD